MVCKHDKKHVQIAPMLAITDQHFRRFFRGISKHVELWTEMHVDATLLHATNLKEVLFCDPLDHPVVCQLGGSHSETLAKAASIACQWGYNEINLNCGCPSARVATKGCFGASLMKKPDRVAEIVNDIHRTVGSHIPVSIKCRTGVDHDYDSFTHLNNFVSSVSQKSQCTRFIIHARKAWLAGLNPKKNRTLPPLQYHRVYQLSYLYPKLNITLNGGVTSLGDIQKLLSCQWRPSYSDFHSLPTTLDLVSENKQKPIDCKKEKQHLFNTNVIENEQDSSYVHKPPESISFTTSNAVHNHSFLHSSTIDSALPYDTTNLIYLNDLSYDNAYFLMNTLETSMKQDASKTYLQGIMIGRMAFNQPCLFSCTDSMFYNSYDPLTARTPRTLANYYEDYLNTFYPDCENTKSIYTLLKPTLGLLAGRAGCKLYRQSLEKIIRQEGSRVCAGDILAKALLQVDEQFPGVLDFPNKTVCAEKNVINALSRIIKTIHTTKEIYDSSRNLEIKLSPSYILIRYCNPLCFERVHAYAYFDTKELFTECLIESRHENIIGLSIDAQGFIWSVKPGCKAYQTAVKLAKDEYSRYLSFQFFLLDNKAKSYKIYKNCLIELLPGRYAETLVPPPNTLTGCCIELRSLQSIRSVVEQMRHLGVDHLTFKLSPCHDDQNNNDPNDMLNISTSNQKAYDLQMSADTDLTTQWVTNHRCVLHTFQESQQEDLFESPPNNHISHNDAEIFIPQTYLIKNLHQLLQLGSALSYEFVLLKFISDQCLIVTFPLLRIQHAHVTCVTSNLTSVL